MTALNDARAHLAKAVEFLDEAESALANRHPNAATSNAVVAGINAKDVICLALSGRTGKADNHGAAVSELRRSGKAGADVATTLDRLLKPKTKSQYQTTPMSEKDAEAAIRCARQLVDAARQVLPRDKSQNADSRNTQ